MKEEKEGREEGWEGKEEEREEAEMDNRREGSV